MSDEISEETKQQIAEAIFTENKILAIKLYREASGQGLAEAKEFIESLTAELRESSPDKFKPLSSSAGCGSSTVFCLVLVGTVTWFVM